MLTARNLEYKPEMAKVTDIRKPFLDKFSRKRYKTQIGKELKQTLQNSLEINYSTKTPNLHELGVLENITQIYANKGQKKSLTWSQRDERVNQILEENAKSFSEETYNIVDEIFERVSQYRKNKEDFSSYFTKNQIKNYVPKTKLGNEIKETVNKKIEDNYKGFSQVELETIYKATKIYGSKKTWDTRREQIEELISQNAKELSDETFNLLEKLSSKATSTKYVTALYEKPYNPTDYHSLRINKKINKIHNHDHTNQIQDEFAQELKKQNSIEDKIIETKSYLNEFYLTTSKNQDQEYISNLKNFENQLLQFSNIVSSEIINDNENLIKEIKLIRTGLKEKINKYNLNNSNSKLQTTVLSNEGNFTESRKSKRNITIVKGLFYTSLIALYSGIIYIAFNSEKIVPAINNLEKIISNLI